MPVRKIILETKPTAQPRARVTRWGTYDAAKDRKNWAKLQAVEQIMEKLDCPLEINIIYFLPIPKSSSKKKRAAMLNGDIKHVKRPDIDNYIKFSLDVLNDLAYVDDSQIYSLKAQKIYAEKPRTEIILTWKETGC